MEVNVVCWNVRGLNNERKQKYIRQAMGQQKVDLALLNETRLNSLITFEGYNPEKTLRSKGGGCLTFSNLPKHLRVKSLGNYLNWTRIQMGQEWIHVLNVYIEPGFKEHVVKRAEKTIAIVKDMIR